ncbi:hypothetical protein AX15_001159 [Amanita polypyramis BW_CC]|nr:hypothetical protein AX15_001159 [Amanita polypyramis BW_CC]
MSVPSFPCAQQAQIIRAHQRDVYHLSSLKDQAENVVRNFLGTRRLARWDKELDFLVKVVYYGFTTGRATQTLGEEYTDIWQYSNSHRELPPPGRLRLALVLLPTLPYYLFSKWNQSSFLPACLRNFTATLRKALPIVAELNLALFYIAGMYYDVIKRALGVQYLSSMPENPHIRPPTYSLLGIMLIVRLLHRLVSSIRQKRVAESGAHQAQRVVASSADQEMFIDHRPVSSLVGRSLEAEQEKSAEEDEGTVLDITAISGAVRAGRNCTLCLEERTNSCSTECGHLFCWDCIIGWGREKAECPLCRQSLDLTRLLPIYNL